MGHVADRLGEDRRCRQEDLHRALRHRDHPCAAGSHHRDGHHQDHQDRPCAARNRQGELLQDHSDRPCAAQNRQGERHRDHRCHRDEARSWRRRRDLRARHLRRGVHCRAAEEWDDPTPTLGDRHLAAEEWADRTWTLVDREAWHLAHELVACPEAGLLADGRLGEATVVPPHQRQHVALPMSVRSR